MSKFFTGSLCLTDLINAAKKQHSSFNKAESNGKIYANIILWENDEADDYGNTHSIQLNSTKEKRESEDKVYVGRAKPAKREEPKPISKSDAKAIDDLTDDLPF